MNNTPGSPGFFSSRRLHLLLIAFLCLLAYSNTFNASFHLDDFHNIVDNPKIREVTNVPLMFVEIEGPLASRPLTLASFSLDYSFWGTATAGYHLVNLMLHIMNGMMLYLLIVSTAKLIEMEGRKTDLIALFSSLIFVVHPIQTESVTYIVTRSMLLATFFYLLGILVFLKAVETRGSATRRKAVYIAALFLISLMGMASREDFVTFPIVLGLYDYFFVSKFSAGNTLRRWKVHLPVWASLVYLSYLVLNYKYSGAGFDLENGLNPAKYLLTQFNVHWTYLRLLFMPINQNLDYDYPVAGGILEFTTLLCSAGYLALWCIAIYFSRSKRVIAFPLLWFLVTLMPASSFIPLFDVVFEHRLYLPSVGFIIVAVAGIFYLSDTLRIRWYLMPKLVVMALTLIVLVLAGGTYSRNRVWADEFTLWGDVIRKSPNKARGYNNLAMEYKLTNQNEIATELLQKAILINPTYILAHNNLAAIYTETGNPEKAIELLIVTLKLKPDSSLTNLNIGSAYRVAGQIDRAIEHLMTAKKLNPGLKEAYYQLGRAYIEKGMYVKAIGNLQTALKIRPNDDKAWLALSEASSAIGQMEDAISYYNIALKLNPDLEKTQQN